MSKYRKKPVVIDAIQFKGTWDSMAEIEGLFPNIIINGMYLENDKVTVPFFNCVTIHGQDTKVVPGDWILPEGDGIHFYPCKPDIFEKTYEKVND